MTNVFQEEQVPREEKIHYLEPTVIVLDEGAEEQQKQRSETSSNSQSQPKGSVTPRFLCFLGIIFCSIFGLGMFLLSLISTVMSTCFLFRRKSVNSATVEFWKLTLQTLAAGIGCTIGLISPAFGIGLIVLFFSVTGGAGGNNLLHVILKQSFNQKF